METTGSCGQIGMISLRGDVRSQSEAWDMLLLQPYLVGVARVQGSLAWKSGERLTRHVLIERATVRGSLKEQEWDG